MAKKRKRKLNYRQRIAKERREDIERKHWVRLFKEWLALIRRDS